MAVRRSSGPGGIGWPSLSLRFLLKMEGMIKRSVMIASNTLSLQEDSGPGVLEGKPIISGVGVGHPVKEGASQG